MEKLLNFNDLSKNLHISSRDAHNFLKEGKLKGQLIKGQWRFTKEDIKSFKKQNLINM